MYCIIFLFLSSKLLPILLNPKNLHLFIQQKKSGQSDRSFSPRRPLIIGFQYPLRLSRNSLQYVELDLVYHHNGFCRKRHNRPKRSWF